MPDSHRDLTYIVILSNVEDLLSAGTRSDAAAGRSTGCLAAANKPQVFDVEEGLAIRVPSLHSR